MQVTEAGAGSKSKRETLRIVIDKKWTAYQFSVFVGDIDRLYFLALASVHDNKKSPLKSRLKLLLWMFASQERYPAGAEAASLSSTEEGLVVKRIAYASPGAIDFIGVGEAVKQLKEILLGIIDRYNHRGLAREKVNEQRLKNLERIFELAAKYDFSADEVHRMAGEMEAIEKRIRELAWERKIALVSGVQTKPSSKAKRTKAKKIDPSA